jgi:hypothetical protein
VSLSERPQPRLAGEPLGDRLVGHSPDVRSSRRDVEQRPLDRCDAQSVAAGGFVGAEREAVEAQGVLVAAVRRNGNVDRRGRGQHSIRHECARMAQVRILSAGEQRPDQPAPHRKRAERVHIAVNTPVATGGQPVVDHALAQPGGEQLSALRDAVLAVENPLRVADLRPPVTNQ